MENNKIKELMMLDNDLEYYKINDNNQEEKININKGNYINNPHHEFALIDIKRMSEALKSKSIKVPSGLSREETRQFIIQNAK